MGLLGHLPAARFHPLLTVFTVAAVLVGSQLGSRLMAGKVKPRGVRYVFAIVLFMVALLLLRDVFR